MFKSNKLFQLLESFKKRYGIDYEVYSDEQQLVILYNKRNGLVQTIESNANLDVQTVLMKNVEADYWSLDRSYKYVLVIRLEEDNVSERKFERIILEELNKCTLKSKLDRLPK